jgi:transposase InsO family protein
MGSSRSAASSRTAPSTYWLHAARRAQPALRPARAQRDDVLVEHIERVWRDNMQVYGARKVWRQLQREGITVARCTVERLMRRQGLRGVVRGKVVRTTVADTATFLPSDKVNRQFRADHPNQLWLSGFTYVPTWQGFVYVAFVIDVFARRIVGWRASSSMRTDFVLDALEQALYERRPTEEDRLVHHSDRGSQYCSHEFQHALQGYAMRSSMSRKGNCWDNSPTESLWSRLKVGGLHGRKFATLRQAMDEVVDWLTFYNYRRRHSSLGYLSPMQYEQRWHAAQHKNAA